MRCLLLFRPTPHRIYCSLNGILLACQISCTCKAFGSLKPFYASGTCTCNVTPTPKAKLLPLPLPRPSYCHSHSQGQVTVTPTFPNAIDLASMEAGGRRSVQYSPVLYCTVLYGVVAKRSTGPFLSSREDFKCRTRRYHVLSIHGRVAARTSFARSRLGALVLISIDYSGIGVLLSSCPRSLLLPLVNNRLHPSTVTCSPSSSIHQIYLDASPSLFAEAPSRLSQVCSSQQLQAQFLSIFSIEGSRQ
jgi:hypothetical protein